MSKIEPKAAYKYFCLSSVDKYALSIISCAKEVKSSTKRPVKELKSRFSLSSKSFNSSSSSKVAVPRIFFYNISAKRPYCLVI